MTKTDQNGGRPAKAKRVTNHSGAVGLLLAFGAIALAFALQNGDFDDFLQWRAAMLVLLGTAGAVLVTAPLGVIRGALADAQRLPAEQPEDTAAALELISELAKKSRRLGIAALEQDLEKIPAPLLRRGLRLAADGLPAEEVMQTMRLETRLQYKRLLSHAKVFESGAGYAPTLGIVGAVLGLIGVMKHLDQVALLGHGVAEAFASTVYGLLLANLVLLPIAGRLRASAAQWLESKEMLIDGLSLLMERTHPIMVEERLGPYTIEAGRNSAKGRASGPSAQMALVRGA